MTDLLKRGKGQFFTRGNPFVFTLFNDWMNKALDEKSDSILLEPFAGSNSIIKLIRDAYPELNNQWHCFDIDPESNEKNLTDIPITIQDVLSDFPKSYHIAITNPPYLAKNSATRRGISFPHDQYDDLYKYSLHVMLENVPYVAAIIPESFIVQGLFHSRLYGVISLKDKMFDDTECPVCLALFIPENKKDESTNFLIYSNDDYIGSYQELKKYNSKPFKNYINMKFNDPNGEISVITIDGTKENSIKFLDGNAISPDKIKVSSRSFTKISGFSGFTSLDIFSIIEESNNILMERRYKTEDVFMTAFKGLRKDGKYRRRLDFAQVRDIINIAVERLFPERF